MAQQQIITKPYVEELQDNDSLFINHDGALRQIKKSDADFASGVDMRAEVSAREAFEAQEVAAREAFEKSETAAREQFETNIDGQIAEKANVDGYYEEMTVGDAEQLISSMYAENSEPYGYRTTGGSADVGNRTYLDKIVGGTVAWNQQLKLDRVKNHNGITASLNDDRSITINGTATSDAYIEIDSRSAFKLNENHKYLYKGCPIGGSGTGYFLGDAWNNMGRDYGSGTIFTATSGDFQPSIIVREGNTVSNLTFKPSLFDLTQMFGSTIADYVYSLEQSQAGAGVAWFKKLFPKDYYEYNAGELLSVEGLESHDTVGFNQWDEEWEVGYLGYSSSNEGQPIPMQNNTIRSKNFIKVLPNTSYYFKYPIAEAHYIWKYDENKNSLGHYQLLASGSNNPFTTPSNCHYIKFACEPAYGTTYKNDICINLSDPSRNGEYEPYEKHSYPLDNSLTLRGIPKLDASNNLYYDGDEYTSDGKVKRKCAEYTFTGNEGWKYYATGDYFYCNPALGAMQSNDNNHQTAVFVGYAQKSSLDDASKRANLSFTLNSSAHAANNFYVRDTSFNGDLNAFKSHITGKKIVFLLATPTAETAEPFQHIQIVDDFGTEEFVSTGIIPVGHNTRYPANLRDKLQHLPDLAGTDGTYLIRQTGKQMSLVYMPAVFPETPTEDGTYTLKTVVTGGAATLQWVAE